MKSKSFVNLIFLAIVLTLSFQIIFAQENKPDLFEVKNIYLEEFDNDKHDDFREMLKNEFNRRMFQFVDTKENADAILSLTFEVEIILHGDRDDLPKPIYGFKLSSPGGKLIWKKELKFQTKGSSEKDDKFASERIIEKFVKDWEKSKSKSKN